MPVDGFETVSIDSAISEQKPAAEIKSATTWPPNPTNNQTGGGFIQRKCSEEGCEQILGHWSKDGTWKYHGAKCDKHSRSKSQ